MKLSDSQREAVEAERNGLFISAAAGSGKTRVLTGRFVRLAAERLATSGKGLSAPTVADRAGKAPEATEPSSSPGRAPLDALVAITFTEKAAGELAQRIRGAVARDLGVEVARETENAWISTIHGLCSRILHRHAFEAGLDPMFAVCDEVQAGVLRRQAFGAALASLSGSDATARLVADYDLTEVEQGVRSVHEYLRSLGLDVGAIIWHEPEVVPALESATSELRGILAEMCALRDRGRTEETNIERLSSLVESLASIEPDDPDRALSTLSALSGFKMNKGCRECAKPLATAAEERAGLLRSESSGHVATAYAAGFLEVLERFWSEYARAKDELGVLDFEDLQLETRDLLRQRPDIAGRYRASLSEIMVDEFQDTNELQLSVVRELAGDALATVGDERQSIYGWRNADVELFRRRQRELDKGRVFELPENFRSHPELIEVFNGLFSVDPFWPEMLKARAGEGESHEDATRERWPDGLGRAQLRLIAADECPEGDKALGEAEAVAEYFETLRDAGFEQKDLVILLRAMTRAEKFESALRARGFDVYVASGGEMFDTAEAEEVEALLRTAANSRDDEAFARLLSGRMVNLSDDGLLLLRGWTKPTRSPAQGVDGEASSGQQPIGGVRSLWEAAKDPLRPVLAETDETLLRYALDAIVGLRESRGFLTLADLIRKGSELLDYDLTLLAAGQERAWANVLKLARLADQYERVGWSDPSAFLDYLDLRREHQRYESQAPMTAEDVDAVRVMSVHAAKGLEFPVVALPELSRKLPSYRATFDCGSPDARVVLGVRLPSDCFDASERDTEASLALREWRSARETDEAKRVLYVACTRATEGLALFSTVSSPKDFLAETPFGWVARAVGIGPDAIMFGDGDEVGAPDKRPETGRQGPSLDVDLGTASIHVEAVHLRSGRSEGAESVPAGAGSSRVCIESTYGAGVVARPVLERQSPAAARPSRISFTGLKTYASCSYRYYATYVARLGSLEMVGPSQQSRVLGSAVHQALQLAGMGSAGSAEVDLDGIAARLGLDEASSDRMRRAVEAFVNSPLSESVLSAPVVLREVPFGVDVSGTILDGAIDLLALFGSRAAVVDYKVGTSELTASTLQQWRLQADCYALAVFDGLSDIAALDVTFFRPEAGAAEETFSYTRDSLSELRARLEGLIGLIAEGVFEPKARYDAGACPECPALGVLCPTPHPHRRT